MISELNARFKGQRCKAVGNDLRVKIAGASHFCYPDVTIVCGPPTFDNQDKKLNVTNPQVDSTP